MACLPKKLWWSLLHPAAVRITSLYLPSMVHDSPMPRSKKMDRIFTPNQSISFTISNTHYSFDYTLSKSDLMILILVIWIHIRWLLIMWQSQRFNFLYCNSWIIYLVKSEKQLLSRSQSTLDISVNADLKSENYKYDTEPHVIFEHTSSKI